MLSAKFKKISIKAAIDTGIKIPLFELPLTVAKA